MLALARLGCCCTFLQAGAPVHCPSLDAAKAAAENYAAERPGRTIAIYELVGYAYRPVEKPAFQDSVTAGNRGSRQDVRREHENQR